jgi:hypothetical protein
MKRAGELPKTRRAPASPAQRRRLALWLAGWRLEREMEQLAAGLRPAPPLRRGPASGAGWGGPARHDPAVREGQIRLLSPRIDGAGARPVYVAVLWREGAGAFLAAPFSRFCEPAFPGELLVRRAPPCLRVLCVWNARALPAALLGRGWEVGRLTTGQLADATVLYRHLRGEGAPPPRYTVRTGPEIRHPFDPRAAYRREESALMNAVEADGAAAAGRELYFPAEASGPLRMVAEPPAEYRAPRGPRKRPGRGAGKPPC